MGEIRRRSRMNKYSLLLLLSTIALKGLTEGQLDTSYNPNGTKPGVESTMIGGAVNSLGYAVTAQADGKIVVAGYASVGGQDVFAVARYLRNGGLDTTFNANGTTPGTAVATFTYDARGYGVALQSDGKIVVVGRVDNTGSGDYRFGIARFKTDGTLDTTFNTTGMVTTEIGTDAEANAVVVRGNKIIVAGYGAISGTMRIAVAQYTSAGALDTANFGSGIGYVTTLVGSNHSGAQGLVVQSDGKIVVASDGRLTGSTSNFIVARYTSLGVLDTTFNASGTQPGIVETDVSGLSNNNYAHDVKLQSDGKIIAGGFAIMAGDVYKMAVARYTTDGVLDTTFNASGSIPGTNVTLAQGSVSTGSQARGYSLAMQPDDKPLIGGWGWGDGATYFAFGIARFNANGTIDTTFNASGAVPGSNATTILGVNNDYGCGIALQPDNRVVVVGTAQTAASQFYFGVARFIALPVEVPAAQETDADSKVSSIGLGTGWVTKAKAFYALLREKYYDWS